MDLYIDLLWQYKAVDIEYSQLERKILLRIFSQGSINTRLSHTPKLK